MKELFKLTFLTLVMGILYLLIEMLYRGNTYWQMALVGGIAGMLIGLINKILNWYTPLWIKGLIGMIIATVCEFIGGFYLNLCIHCGIWDYSNLPFNLCGQICLYYSVAWFFLSLLGIFTYDYIRWKVFGETKPRYKIF